LLPPAHPPKLLETPLRRQRGLNHRHPHPPFTLFNMAVDWEVVQRFLRTWQSWNPTLTSQKARR
ncbi:MAG TPA: hypothetical protein VLL05_09265, partial [Terriglobales bacterium]|nr:hypothetical protein [Terriglobales bacterium]